MINSNLFKNLFIVTIATLLFACNSNTPKNSGNNSSTEPKIDPAKQDSIRKANFMAKYDRYYNDIARLMAGLGQTKGSSLAKFDTLPASKKYHKTIQKFFGDLQKNHLSKMEDFSNKNLKDVRNDSMMLFYPFSGPDFINADAFFPEARTTIMFGLEPVGYVPRISDNISNDELAKVYKILRRSIDSIAHLGYFMTFEMSRDLHMVTQLDGNLSIIALFMAQRNYHILNIKKVVIDDNGNIVDSIPGKIDKDSPKDDYISGGLIEYMKPNEYKVRKLYYFSHDVSDQSLAKTPQMIKFFDKFHIDVAFFKAASYLCSWMKTVREYVLNNANSVVQDDSGIPVKYFKDTEWNKTFYGKYSRTLKVFYRAFFQKGLKEIYDKDTTIIPLKFKFGYGTRIKQSNIMKAKKIQN